MAKHNVPCAKRLRFGVLSSGALFVLSGCGSAIFQSHYEHAYVSVDRPRHWTLDDAHYLMAGLQDRSRDLAIVSPQTLDPNSFNSSRIEKIQTVVSAGIAYDELTGLKNEIDVQKLENSLEDSELARSQLPALNQTRGALEERQLELKIAEARAISETEQRQVIADRIVSDISRNQTRLNGLNDAGSAAQPQREAIANNIVLLEDRLSQARQETDIARAQQSAARIELEATTLRLEQVESEIKDVTSAANSGNVTLNKLELDPVAPTQLAPGAVSSAFADELIDILKADSDVGKSIVPSFNVSDQITNFINAEDELLARQLTRLRTQVGPHHTMVFVELPHSVETLAGRSENRRIQVQWQIESVCLNDPLRPLYDIDINSDGSNGGTNSAQEEEPIYKYELLKGGQPQAAPDKLIASASYDPLVSSSAHSARSVSQETNQLQLSLTEEIEQSLLTRLLEDSAFYIKEACDPNFTRLVNPNPFYVEDFQKDADKVDAYAWDLIPRTNAYNRADFIVRDSDVGFEAFLSFITGIGAQARYNRRKQLFEQFANQEVFATAYGQGSEDFGWVLGPRPTSDLVSSGTKTTYAALIVPKNTTVLNLTSSYCVLSKRTFMDQEIELSGSNTKRDKQCGDAQKHQIPVIKDQSFWVDRIYYSNKSSKDIVTIRVQGKNFSPFQLGIFVDGYPLKQFRRETETMSRSLAALAAASPNQPVGIFEVGDSQNLTMNFKMPQGYEGTPEITLVSPRKTVSLNAIKVRNSAFKSQRVRLAGKLLTPMLQSQLDISQTPPPSVSGPIGNVRQITLHGSGFTEGMDIYYREGDKKRLIELAKNRANVQVLSTKKVVVTLPDAKSWEIILRKSVSQRFETASVLVKRPKSPPAKSVPKPSIRSVEVLSILPGAIEDTIRLRILGQHLPKCFELEESLSGIKLSTKNGNKCELRETQGSTEIYRVSDREMVLQFKTASPQAYLILKDLDRKKPVIITHLLDLRRQPQLHAIVNTQYAPAASCGSAKGDEIISLSGKYLDGVKSVFFGETSVSILSLSENEILVKSPSGTGRVSVYLAGEDKKRFGGLGFTYSGTDCGTKIRQ